MCPGPLKWDAESLRAPPLLYDTLLFLFINTIGALITSVLHSSLTPPLSSYFPTPQ